QADAVFLDCGHGGACMGCAMQVCALQAECPICRGHVTQIIEI
ncbi:unnamed protein product, partial [Phaeothamnion confervicola]